jgi:hypothetical protein
MRKLREFANVSVPWISNGRTGKRNAVPTFVAGIELESCPAIAKAVKLSPDDPFNDTRTGDTWEIGSTPWIETDRTDARAATTSLFVFAELGSEPAITGAVRALPSGRFNDGPE